jgi:hypothetical protein
LTPKRSSHEAPLVSPFCLSYVKWMSACGDPRLPAERNQGRGSRGSA